MKKKNSNYLKNILLSATIIGSMSFAPNSSFAATATDVGSFDELKKEINNATTSNLNLTKDITFSQSGGIGLQLNNKDVTLNGNNNTIHGGNFLGIDVQPSSSLTINDTVFDGFNSSKWGGAVYNEGNLVLKNVTFSNNKTTNNTVTGALANYSKDASNIAVANLYGAMKFENNTADAGWTGYGGAIYNNGEMNIDTEGETAIFQANKSKNFGGAIFTKDKLNLKGNFLFGSEDDATKGNISENKGGALYNEGTVISDAEMIFANNTATYHGGAIKNVGNMTLDSSNDKLVSFISNTAQQGGAIFNEGTLTINQNANFKNNTAGVGGAIFNYTTGNITLNGANIFENNNSSTSAGGAIYNAGTLSMSNSGSDLNIFRNNIAFSSGGAIYNIGSLFLNGNYDFIGNKVTKDWSAGGAIFNNGIMNLDGTFTFDSNSAYQNGGALVNEAGNLTINGTRDADGNASIVFKNNTLTSTGETRGGAIYITGKEGKGGTLPTYAYLDINGADFKNNSSNSHGGAIYVDKYVKFNIENSKFENNRVDSSIVTSDKPYYGWGGALGLDSNLDTVYGYIKNSEFTGNYSSDSGAGIPAGTGLTIVNSSFYKNHAADSGSAVSYNPKGLLGDKALKIIADGGDTIFSGNWVGKSDTRTVENSEGLYIGNAITDDGTIHGQAVTGSDGNDSNVYFNAGNQGRIIFNDIVNASGQSYDERGEKNTYKRANVNNPNIQLNQAIKYGRFDEGATQIDAPTSGTIIFNNQIQAANLVLHNGVLTFGQANNIDGYINPTNVTGFKYFANGAKVTLQGGTLDLINGTIESKDNGIFNPESLKVLGNANLRLDLDLANNTIDYIDSDLGGKGTLTIDKISFKEGDTKSTPFGVAQNFQFVRSNLLSANNTILERSLKTVITSNAGYTIDFAENNSNQASTSKDTLAVTKVIDAGGLPVAVSLGQDEALANNRTYIYNATADEEITGTIGDNSWNKGYHIYENGTPQPRETSNVLKGSMLQINGNRQNVFTSDNVIGIEVGQVERAGVMQPQQLIINDVKKSDNSGGWSGFNTALINKGGEITLNNSIFSGNNSHEITGVKKANGGAIFNEDGVININNTSFLNNSADGKGGAIYNYGKTIINATDGNTVTFDGNKAGGIANDIYNDGTLSLAADDKSSIVFNGGISGDSTYGNGIIKIGYTDMDNVGKVVFNNTVSYQDIQLNSGTLQLGANATQGRGDYFKNSTLEMDGGTLNAQNGYIDTIQLDDFSVYDSNSQLLFDVDLKGSGSSDNIQSSSVYGASAIKVGLINILDGFDDGKESARIQFINDNINSYMDDVDRNITINGVSYLVGTDGNYITITKAGQSGGFAYEVINTKPERTYTIGDSDTTVDSWIGGNSNLGGRRFQISGGTAGNALIALNGLKGIIVGDSQQLDITGVTSYQGFDSAVMNNGGKVIVNSTTFENNASTSNGGVIQNNSGTVTINNGTSGTTFQNNSATTQGGAIYNATNGTLEFVIMSDKDITFRKNKVGDVANDIHNDGTMKLTNTSGSGSVVINDGITGSGNIISAANLVLNGDNSGFNGTFTQKLTTEESTEGIANESGTPSTTTVGAGAKFFTGTSNITSGSLIWNTANDIVDGATLTITGASLTVGNGAKLTIKGNSSIANATSVTANGDLILKNNMTVKSIDGTGTITADGSTLTFNSNSTLGDSLNFASKNSATAIINGITDTTNADSVISKIASGSNEDLTLNISDTNSDANITVDGVDISSLNFSGNVNYGGKITGSGNITNSGNLTITGNQSGFDGTYTQNYTAAKTIVDTSANLFGGTKKINGGFLTIKGGNIDYTGIKLGNATFNQTITDAAVKDLNTSVLEFTGTGQAGFTGGNINLSQIANGKSNWLVFNGSNVKLADTNYQGGTIYNFYNNSTIDLMEKEPNVEIKDYVFDYLLTSDNTTNLNFNIKINRDDANDRNYLTTDTLKINSGYGIFKLGNVYITGEENGRRGEYSTENDVIQGNASFDENSSANIVGATTSWQYKLTQTDNNKSVGLEIIDYTGSKTLNDMNITDGERFFQFTQGDTREYHIAKSLDGTAAGKFYVTGDNHNIISGILEGTTDQKGSFFNMTNTVDTKLTINNVTIQDAYKDGNGSVIHNDSENSVTTIVNTIIKNNSVTGDGGAIYNNANKILPSGDEDINLDISNSVFEGNKADGNAGAIYNAGATTITNTAFNGNQADKGGAIYNTGTVTIANTVFDRNKANSEGGAIYNDGTMTITNSEFKTTTDTIYLTNSSSTIFTGTNTINSGISSEEPDTAAGEAAGIWNNGILNLKGDNSGYKCEYIQDEEDTVTNVLNKFFDGYTTIEKGSVNWLTDKSASGHFYMTGGNLNIGDTNHQAVLDLSNDSKIEEAANVRIDRNSTLGIKGDAEVSLDNSDEWYGDIKLNENGTLNLNNIKNFEGAKLTANEGTLNINDGTLIIANNSKIEEAVATNIKSDATLQVNEGGDVTIGASSNWEGKTILNGGDLTVGGLTSNGVIQAGTGNLTVESGTLTVGENSAIASAVTTTIASGSTLYITDGGYVHLGTDDILGGEVTLKGGTLDYAMVTRRGEANVVIANTGNLNLLENSVMDIKSPSVIAKDVVVDIQKGATVNLRSGSELTLDSQDKWNGLVATWTNGVLKTDGVDNTKIGGQLQQNRGTSIFDNKSNILIDGQNNYIVGGNVSILNGSALHLGSGVEHFNVDNLNMANNSLLNVMNDTINKYKVTNMNISGTNNVAIDINPREKVGDTFIINTLNGSNNGTLNVSNFNFVGQAPIDRHIRLQVFDAENVNDVNFTATDKKIFTPIGNYQLISQGGGAYTASLADYNPQVFRGQAATLAAYNHQLLIDDMLTNHFILPNERLIDKAAQANKTSSISPLFAPYQSTIDEGGIWTKSYVSFEQLSMTNNLRVGNNVYGTLIGADFPAVKMKKGWKFIPTAYIGYNGGNQYFNHVDMYQNGGQGGFMGTFIKNNFIGSVTAYGGGYFNEMNVAGNTDRTGNWFAGTAAKAAYNIHATKHFIIQPTAFVSYNIFGKQSWGTDYGAMSMNSGTLNGINVAPGLNLIYSRDTWSVYGTIQYMFNINDQVGGKAGNVKLPNTEMRHGYINYGVGVTKTWKDRLTSFFQINFRNGGRTGVGFQLGLNYLFDWGKPKKQTSQTTPAKAEKRVLKSAK